jgi:cobalamin biosynthesis Mg chelatase CobN
MANEDILGGLKTAILRGFSLKDAMISFYNAGYKKEEIEEAARNLQYQMIENKQRSGNERLWTEEPKEIGVPNSPESVNAKPESSGQATQTVKSSKPEVTTKPQSTLAPKPSQLSSKVEVPKFKPLPKPTESESVKEEPKLQQKSQISSYESSAPKVKAITTVLIAILIILLGLLGVIFLFKDQIISFFNGLF